MNKLVIKKDDLINNVNKIKDLAKDKQIIAVVKFNGYGLDIIQYTKLLIECGINYFAVASTEEAIKLRNSYPEINILNMSSTSITKELESMLKNDIIISIGSSEALKNLKELTSSLNKEANIHIKIDTGFGRYGFLPNDSEIEKCFNNELIKVNGIFSHFSISYFDEKYTRKQFETFKNVIETLESKNYNVGIKHICNSSAFLLYPEMHMDAVRIGSAFLGRIAIENKYDLKRIGTFESYVSEIKVLPANHNIGYSNTYKTKKETKIAIIPCGNINGINMVSKNDKNTFICKLRYVYNDFKQLFKSNNTFVKINDKNYECLGGVGNAFMVIDITNSDVKINDIVEINVNTLHIDSSIERIYK